MTEQFLNGLFNSELNDVNTLYKWANLGQVAFSIKTARYPSVGTLDRKVKTNTPCCSKNDFKFLRLICITYKYFMTYTFEILWQLNLSSSLCLICVLFSVWFNDYQHEIKYPLLVHSKVLTNI